MEPTTESLVRRIERAAAAAGIYVVAEEDGKSIVLSGMVSSDEERQAAVDIAQALAPDMRVEDNLDVTSVLPETVGGIELAKSEVGGMRGATPGLAQEEGLEAGDFTDQRLGTNPLAAAGAGATGADDDLGAEGGDAYVPPMDPVGTSRAIIGGFETSSMDSVEVELSELDQAPGDEGITDAIRRELHEDAATTDLEVRIIVRNGVVHLHGTVPTLDDAENVEEVASRVPGVVEVREELDVRAGRVHP